MPLVAELEHVLRQALSNVIAMSPWPLSYFSTWVVRFPLCQSPSAPYCRCGSLGIECLFFFLVLLHKTHDGQAMHLQTMPAANSACSAVHEHSVCWMALGLAGLNGSFHSFFTTLIGHWSHVIGGFWVLPKFTALKHIAQFRKWLGNCSFSSSISLFYLVSWWIIRNKSLAPISGSTCQAWRGVMLVKTRHVTKEEINHTIRQHRLQVLRMIAAVKTVWCSIFRY